MLDPSVAAAIAWKTSLLLVAIGLIASLTTKQSAARRHFLWTCALALSLLMPVAVVSLPSSVQVTLPWEAAAAMGTRHARARRTAAREAAASEVRAPAPDELAAAARPTRTASSAAMIVWLIGAAVVMLRNALAHVGLMRWVRQARTDLSPAWGATLRRVATDAALRRPLRVSSPITRRVPAPSDSCGRSSCSPPLALTGPRRSADSRCCTSSHTCVASTTSPRRSRAWLAPCIGITRSCGSPPSR